MKKCKFIRTNKQNVFRIEHEKIYFNNNINYAGMHDFF